MNLILYVRIISANYAVSLVQGKGEGLSDRQEGSILGNFKEVPLY